MKAPVYTMGIDPQSDRGMLCDFFEAIKNWSATYTINPFTLSASQTHTLTSHPILTSTFGPSARIAMFVLQKDMLVPMITALISRSIFTRTIDEHALYLSCHPHAPVTTYLANEWALLSPTDSDAKAALLKSQKEIYAAIKGLPDYHSWRATCAEYLSSNLTTTTLSGLLNNNLPVHALKHRDHLMQELFVKGYRIGFRLRMEAVRWDAVWPVVGETFSKSTMVNESRLLYRNPLSTMERVSREEEMHEVLFAVSPTMWKREGGSEQVVHRGCVHIARKDGI
jgi:hypothetical protein